MLTYSDWLKMDLKDRNNLRDEITYSIRTLKAVYRGTIEHRPADTVAAFISEVGYQAASSTLATLINRHGWDGRISRRAKAWAAGISPAFDEEAAMQLGMYADDVIHLCHLDQIAVAMAKVNPGSCPA